jgi:hypothetical protein
MSALLSGYSNPHTRHLLQRAATCCIVTLFAKMALRAVVTAARLLVAFHSVDSDVRAIPTFFV